MVSCDPSKCLLNLLHVYFHYPGVPRGLAIRTNFGIMSERVSTVIKIAFLRYIGYLWKPLPWQSPTPYVTV